MQYYVSQIFFVVCRCDVSVTLVISQFFEHWARRLCVFNFRVFFFFNFFFNFVFTSCRFKAPLYVTRDRSLLFIDSILIRIFSSSYHYRTNSRENISNC